MKSVFDINIDTEKYDGESFITERVNEDEQEQQNTLLNSLNLTEKKSRLPLGLSIVKYICLFVVLVTLAGVIRSSPNISLQQMFENASWLIIAAFVCAVVHLALVLIERSMKNKVQKSGELERLSKQASEIAETQSKSLNLPDNAENIEIFYCCYKINKGKPKKQYPFTLNPFNYQAQMIRCAVQNGDLILFNFDGKFVIPRSDIRSLKQIKKAIAVDEWVQDEPIYSERFKPYKIGQYEGVVNHRGYLALILSDDFGDFFIRFPLYEEDKLQRLIGPIEVVPGKAKEFPL
ncbi:MAG: hypothetical protein ACI3YK_06280 [Eubacteriales bacterium]